MEKLSKYLNRFFRKVKGKKKRRVNVNINEVWKGLLKALGLRKKKKFKLPNPFKWLKNRKNQRKKFKPLKTIRKSFKKAFKKENLAKIIIIIATAAMLLPLLLPFLG